MARAFVVLESRIGPFALAWGDAGVTHVELPIGAKEARSAVAKRLRARAPDAEEVARAPRAHAPLAAALRRGLGGDHAALAALQGGVHLDYGPSPAFHRRVYDALRGVPAGVTVTYGELAALAGSPGASRAVGQAMARNPVPIVVPCHRVLASGGKPGGFSAAGGAALKARLLELEGVRLAPEGPLLRLTFDADAAARAIGAADARLRRVVDLAAAPYRLPRPPHAETFDALLRAIVYQQLSGKAAATILARVKALYVHERPTPEGVLATKEAKLRAAGLSAAKAAAIRDLARRTLDGEVPPVARLRRMDDEAIVEALTRVRGIGRWTVEMLLMFRLGRPDVLPVSDLGVRAGAQATYGLAGMPTPAELTERAEVWRPFRSVGSWYMWRAVELARAGRL